MKTALTEPGHALVTPKAQSRVVTALSLKLSRALAHGRRIAAPPASRATLLATLLRKRATAHNIGDEDLEALLRDQIRWALPIERESAE